MRYKARMEAEERRNNTFAERLVLVVEIELRDLWFMEKEILNEVAKLMRLLMQLQKQINYLIQLESQLFQRKLKTH